MLLLLSFLAFLDGGRYVAFATVISPLHLDFFGLLSASAKESFFYCHRLVDQTFDSLLDA